MIENRIIKIIAIQKRDKDSIGDKKSPMLNDTVAFVNIPIPINSITVMIAGISPNVSFINM